MSVPPLFVPKLFQRLISDKVQLFSLPTIARLLYLLLHQQLPLRNTAATNVLAAASPTFFACGATRTGALPLLQNN